MTSEQLDAVDRGRHQALCEANGHRGTFPRVEMWSKEARSASQNYIAGGSGWIVVTDKPGDLPSGIGIPLRCLRWTRQRIRADTWDRPRIAGGELVTLDAYRS